MGLMREGVIIAFMPSPKFLNKLLISINSVSQTCLIVRIIWSLLNIQNSLASLEILIQ